MVKVHLAPPAPVQNGAKMAERLVGVPRIELGTPAMSTQCSTTELYAHALALLPVLCAAARAVHYKELGTRASGK